MHICYADESGDSQLIANAQDDKQPVLVIGGLFVDASSIVTLTRQFNALKRRFYPAEFAAAQHALDALLIEVKGSDIRTRVRKASSADDVSLKRDFRFLDEVLRLCKTHQVRLVARVWVKQFGAALDDKPVYTQTMQNIAARFQAYLAERTSRGTIIADYRDPKKNQYVSHCVFTQKHKVTNGGDAYPLIEETATFGMSNNHACLQIMDLLCSAIIAPIAGRVVLDGIVQNVHTHKNYEWIVRRFSRRLHALQFHHTIGSQPNAPMRWGITVHDPHRRKKSLLRR